MPGLQPRAQGAVAEDGGHGSTFYFASSSRLVVSAFELPWPCSPSLLTNQRSPRCRACVSWLRPAKHASHLFPYRPHLWSCCGHPDCASLSFWIICIQYRWKREHILIYLKTTRQEECPRRNETSNGATNENDDQRYDCGCPYRLVVRCRHVKSTNLH